YSCLILKLSSRGIGVCSLYGYFVVRAENLTFVAGVPPLLIQLKPTFPSLLISPWSFCVIQALLPLIDVIAAFADFVAALVESQFIISAASKTKSVAMLIQSPTVSW